MRMTGKQLKLELKRLKKKIGGDQLKRELVAGGLGFSTAEKLTNDVYDHNPRERVANIIIGLLAKHSEAQAS